jgi:hypothetical protein
MLWIVKVMNQSMPDTACLKAFGKLATIISLYSPNGKRSHPEELAHKIIPVGRRIIFVRVGKGKSSPDIDGSENVTFQPGRKDGDGIHLYQVSRLIGREAFTSEFLLTLYLSY